jgi:hypothetical protein
MDSIAIKFLVANLVANRASANWRPLGLSMTWATQFAL